MYKHRQQLVERLPRSASLGHGITARALASLAVLLVAIAGVAAPAHAAPNAPTGSAGVRLLDAPTRTGNDPRARLYIVDHVAPGTVIHRRIEVSNTTDSTAHVALYPAAAAITKGSFLGAPGHTANDLSMWTSVTPTAPDVAAKEHITATVTITVPRDASPGERYGVVWAEVRSAPAAGGGGVTEINRVGIRLYLSIGPGGPPAASFAITSLTAQRQPDGRPAVLATVHNTGGRALDMYGSLRLSAGPGGSSAGPFPAALGTTLALGETEPVTIMLDRQLPAGPWNARITLHSGLLTRTAHATITFAITGTSPTVKPATSTRSGWLYALMGGLFLLLLVLAMLLIALRRRRRRRPTTV